MSDHQIVVDDEWEAKMIAKGWTVSSSHVTLKTPLEVKEGDVVEIAIHNEAENGEV